MNNHYCHFLLSYFIFLYAWFVVLHFQLVFQVILEHWQQLILSPAFSITLSAFFIIADRPESENIYCYLTVGFTPDPFFSSFTSSEY